MDRKLHNMYAKALFFCAVALFLFNACSTQKYQIDQLPPTQLRMGNGGGFSGLSKEFRVLENGQIFLFELASWRKDTFELEPLPRAKARELFREMEALRLPRYDFNFPGDMAYFLRTSDEIIDHAVQWGDPRRKVRADVEAFYLKWKSLLEGQRVIGQIKYQPAKPKNGEPVFW